MKDAATVAGPAALQAFALDQLPARPWKNGGGVTREIACWPPGAGLDDFDWRISVATIAAAGPFSAFPGVDRQIVLLDGDGVRLRGGGIDHRLDRRLEPFAFAGDLPLDCDLLGGPSTDFNLMLRRGRGSASLEVVDRAVAAIDVAQGLLLVTDGHAHCTHLPASAAGGDGDGATIELGPGDGLFWTRPVGSLGLVPVARAAAMQCLLVRFETALTGTR